jgi:glucose-1-phosphate thymidylyltransferase
VIGVVPAAGHATRLGALDGSKELLEVGGVPVIEHLLRRLEAGGCTEIRLVTRPEKEDLRTAAERRGLRVVLGRPPHVGASVALGLEALAPDAVVALGFPDTIWEPLNGFALLRDALDADADAVLGLFETPDTVRSDVVVADAAGRVRELLVKPARPPSTRIWGCLVARAGALAGVDATAEMSHALGPAVAAGRVRSRLLSDRWIDVGVPEALAQAREALAARSPSAGRG